ncbi:ubiquitin carboxyl-terminal hydrolase-domain-containing protein [Bombardia bombarda]|uniref:ubiquitinyl hydrolase 1 n=1 Tax=Bombardia bombarda TaxID=252184 RepID=A0AA40CG43_9PEZI|nr:ubiquitin carboxyl-terminal hydrolase-domain-containing protein [Bombardia bombarda]
MKAAVQIPKKFRSMRDRNSDSNHRRNKSSEPKGRALTSERWLSVFKSESDRQTQKEKVEEEKELAKIEDITRRLEELKYNGISEEIVRYALNSKFASGDPDKATDILKLQQQAWSGIIQPYNPNVPMVGAENRGAVTCYLDALLFAMFAKMGAFECMLKNDLKDEEQNKLAALLRLWVNMLRSGKLIHTDMTQHIQESLAACGWKDAERLEQQDTSEAFGFITETLQLPLFALQVDLFHQGQKDVDDHKVVHERLLNLAVPPDPEGKGIKLEDCLEEYFNNKVDVLRESLIEDKKSSSDQLGSGPKRTIRAVIPEEEDEAQGSSEQSENPQLQRRWTTIPNSLVEYPIPPTMPALRHRSTSIIQRIVVHEDGQTEDIEETEDQSLISRGKRAGSTVVKAVTIPAWQFFRLIPWHATTNTEPKSDVEVARHFNQRPVLGICLKRYTMTEQGIPRRHNTLIDIPDSLRLPHFMMADELAATNGDQQDSVDGLAQEYKLVLQSVVCHRGDSLHSGHYVAFARVAPKLLTDNRRHDLDPPPDYEEAQWAKFDDLAEDRVVYVDDIKQSLREEMPYLLFYQIVPMVDVAAPSTDGSAVEDPPSYNEMNNTGAAVFMAPDTPGPVMSEYVAVGGGGATTDGSNSRRASDYFDFVTVGTGSMTGGPSIRLSSELEPEQESRLSFDDDPYSIVHLRTGNGGAATDYSRRASVALSEANTAVTSAAGSMSAVGLVTTSAEPSPAVTPSEDTSTAARLSRAAAKFTGKTTGSGGGGEKTKSSRPSSQAGEGRISITMSRLGFARASRDPLPAVVVPTVNGVEELEEQAVVVEEENADGGSGGGGEGEEKQHRLLHYHKKDRTKSKSKGEKDDKEKGGDGKGKKDKDKEGSGGGRHGPEPDRECAVM